MTTPQQISGETDHFWYRVETGKPYIDSQRGNKAFGRGDGKVIGNGSSIAPECLSRMGREYRKRAVAAAVIYE